METARPAILSVTDAAAQRIQYLLAKSQKPVMGLRVGTVKGGCAGLSYNIDYAENARPGEEVIDAKGVKLFVEPTAVLHLIGTEMDFIEDTLTSRFVFNNPNKKASCGCGESFSV
ncbi:MAG: iron-sulfur cluster assembly accessory protein [Rickettsiales bacterium]|jgi:iron-sulfur cluster assembly protein|nr:iron-sulfur cluster assembly accessory protein [Rickettsiales bacterium]